MGKLRRWNFEGVNIQMQTKFSLIMNILKTL